MEGPTFSQRASSCLRDVSFWSGPIDGSPFETPQHKGSYCKNTSCMETTTRTSCLGWQGATGVFRTTGKRPQDWTVRGEF